MLLKKEDPPILSGLTKVSNFNPKEGKKSNKKCDPTGNVYQVFEPDNKTLNLYQVK